MQAEQVESSLGVRRSLVCEPSSWKLQWEKGAFNTYVEKKKDLCGLQQETLYLTAAQHC